MHIRFSVRPEASRAEAVWLEQQLLWLLLLVTVHDRTSLVVVVVAACMLEWRHAVTYSELDLRQDRTRAKMTVVTAAEYDACSGKRKAIETHLGRLLRRLLLDLRYRRRSSSLSFAPALPPPCLLSMTFLIYTPSTRLRTAVELSMAHFFSTFSVFFMHTATNAMRYALCCFTIWGALSGSGWCKQMQVILRVYFRKNKSKLTL